MRFFWLALAGILCLQLLAGLWHISDPFIDGSQHYNWGPPFWLMKAQAINEIGLTHTYFGLKDYASHPQLIAPVIALWTSAAGYSEASIRFLSLLLTVLATFLLALGSREFLGNSRSLMFTCIFASLPLVYIFGKKLDQEALVLVFLALTLWGLARILHSRKFGFVITFFGGLGMMLSDWSGAIFAFVLGITAACLLYRQNRTAAVKTAFVLFTGAGIGLTLYILQSYLQAGSPSISAFVGSYIELWKYRAGLGTVHLTPFVWTVKQYYFLQVNYTIPLFLMGIIGLAAILIKKESGPNDLWRFGVLSCATLCASLIYMIAVPQASAIHTYFQYYISISIAAGVLFSLTLVSCWLQSRTKKDFLVALFPILLVATALTTANTYAETFRVQFGDDSDVQLVKNLREIPEDETVVAAANEENVLAWFQNPNMRYYSGRDIPSYNFNDGVPLSNYMIVREESSGQVIAQINSNGYLGHNAKASQEACSTNFCVIKILTR